jgi:hypothetical protein
MKHLHVIIRGQKGTQNPTPMVLFCARLLSFVLLSATTLCFPVSAQVTCAPQPGNLISWWPAEGNATDTVGGNNGSLVNGATFATGLVGQAFSFNGANQIVQIPDAPSLNPTNSLTLEAWVYLTDYSANDGIAIAGKDNPLGARGYFLSMGNVGGQWKFGAVVTVQGGLTSVSGATAAQLNTWYHVAMTYDGAALKLFVNGVLDGSLPLTGRLVVTANPFWIGGALTGPWNFIGYVDEAALYNRALSTAEIQAIYAAGSAGKCSGPTPPFIYVQPIDQTGTAGTNISFTLIAGGSSPLTYQWTHDGVMLAGATNSTLSLTNIQLSQAGLYAVNITNAFGYSVSSNAVLTVTPLGPCAPPPPGLIAWWPGENSAADVVGGNNGTLVAGASYDWGMVGHGFALNGAGQDVTIPNAPVLNPLGTLTVESWVYPVSAPGSGMGIVCKDDGGANRQYILNLVTSGQAQPIFRAHVGTSGGLVVLNGTNTVPLNTWTHVAMTYDGAILRLYVNGALDSALTANGPLTVTTQPVLIGSDAGGYFFNGRIDEVSLYGRALSLQEIQTIYNSTNAGKCLVPVPPFIVSQPTNQTIFITSNATLSVAAGGTIPLSYQWNANGSPIAGATNSSLTLTNVQFPQAGSYAVSVTNSVGSVVSSNAVLNLIYPPALVQIGSTNVASGGTISLPVTLLANGNENALGLSLSFDQTKLAYAGASLGSGAVGAVLLSNTSMTNTGKIGLAAALPPNMAFSMGTQRVFQVNFTAAVVTNGASTPITFGDQPTLRQLWDSQLNSLLVNFSTGAVVSVAAAAFEGDVFPRPGGDRSITLSDWLQMGRYAARLDYPTNAAEFQRADCAPRATSGDGAITVTDWVQSGRYAFGLDPWALASGPTNEITGPPPSPSTNRFLTAGAVALAANQLSTLGLSLSSQGNENAAGLSLIFDPARVRFAGASLGADAGGATLYVNTNQATSGQLGLALALGTGNTFGAGSRELVMLTFQAAAGASGTFSPGFGDFPVPREISDSIANSLPVSFVNATLTNFPPPTLGIALAGNAVRLFWPLTASNFIPQQASTISGPSVFWTNLTVTPVISNSQNNVTLPLSGGSKFYRLFHP